MYARYKYDPTKPKSWCNVDLSSDEEEEEEEEEPVSRYVEEPVEYEDNSAW